MADSKIASVAQLKTADQLAAKRQELEDLRVEDRREWSLNRAFYNGSQWVYWDRNNQQVVSLPVQEGDKPRHKVRLTDNQIRKGVKNYTAQLTKTKPIIQAQPDSAAYRDKMSAEMANSLFEWWWQELCLKSKLQSAMIHTSISQGYWKITWDPLAGKSMKILVGPDGKPVTDDEIADIYREELTKVAQQQGIDPAQLMGQFEKTIYVGDISVEALPGENVYLDPAPADYTLARYVICKHALDVDEIKERFGVDVEPNVTTSTNLPLMYQRKIDKAPKTVRDVFIGYFKPTPLKPEGRMVVWIEEPNKILKDDKWPYPFNDLPIVKFPGNERPGSPLDEPLVSDVRPIQKELNRTLSQIVQHKDLTIKPQMLAPVGSLRERLTDEPGAVFQYQPIQGLMPQWRDMLSLPKSAFDILNDIQRRIDEKFHRIPSQRDALPARIDAGYGIEMVQEAVADELSPTIQRMEESLARAGKLMVMLAQAYYIEPRLMKIKGANGSTQVRKFMNSDLAGGFSFHAVSGSGLPRSRAGRQARILELVDKQMIDPKKAMRLLDLGDLDEISSQAASDEDQAYREHEMLIKGEPINPVAMAQAEQQAQQLMQDPTADLDGDGIPDPPEAKLQAIQGMLAQASVAPTDFEDWESHLDVHRLYMKSVEFNRLPVDAQTRFVDHWNATYQRIIAVKTASLTLDPRVRPKVNLNLKATTSAPVAAEILEGSGVHTDEHEVAEAPLETAVYDSLDKPNTDSAGNNPMDPMEQIQAMQHAEEQHQLTTAKAAHQVAMAQQQAAHAEQTHQDNLARQSQQHAQQLTHAEQMHREKVKQARKPKPKPKKGA